MLQRTQSGAMIAMTIATAFLILLIAGSPVFVLFDNLIAQGLIGVIGAIAIGLVAKAVRSDEIAHLQRLLRWLFIVALVPIALMLIQILPLGPLGLAHPIWTSAQNALGVRLFGSISIDPSATLVALGRYLSFVGIVFVTMAVAFERNRAEWILLALCAAATITAIILYGYDFAVPNGLSAVDTHVRATALAASTLGVMFTGAGIIWRYERYETRHLRGSGASLLLMLAISICAFVVCTSVVGFCGAAHELFFAGCGLATLLTIVLIRRLGLELWGEMGLAAFVLVLVAALTAVQHPEMKSKFISLAFARQIELVAATERALAAAPWLGTGAGAFAAILTIYRDTSDAVPFINAPTAMAAVGVEMGWVFMWFVVVVAILFFAILFHGALHRGRDSFYATAGAGTTLAIALEAFSDSSIFNSGVIILAAAMLGLSLTQRVSRSTV